MLNHRLQKLRVHKFRHPIRTPFEVLVIPLKLSILHTVNNSFLYATRLARKDSVSHIHHIRNVTLLGQRDALKATSKLPSHGVFT